MSEYFHLNHFYLNYSDTYTPFQMGTFLLNPIIGITPKSIYPISYVNSGEPRWGNASSSPFRRLPQYLFHTSSIHITTYPIATTQPQNLLQSHYDTKPNCDITQLRQSNPKSNLDILRHSYTLRHHPIPYSYFCHQHYDFGSS